MRTRAAARNLAAALLRGAGGTTATTTKSPMLSTFLVAPQTSSSSASSSSLFLRFSSSWISNGVTYHQNDAIQIKSNQRLSGSSVSDAASSASSSLLQTRAASTSSGSSRRPPSSPSSPPPPPSPSQADDRGYDADAESDSLTEDEHRKSRKGPSAAAAAATAAASAKRKSGGKAAEAEAEAAAAAAEAETASFSSFASSSWPGSDVEDEDDASKSSAEDDEEEDEEGGDRSAALRDALFEEALTKIPELGWSHEALAAAAVSLHLSPAAARLARRGPADLALWYIRKSNDEFAASLGEGFNAAAAAAATATACVPRLEELAALPGTTARIEAAIWWRLQPVARFSSSWHQAVAAVALAGPRAAAEAARELWRWSDDAWTLAAGDRPPKVEGEEEQENDATSSSSSSSSSSSPSSSSYASSYYSKRATLSAVYAACELHLLADFSPDHEETRRSVRRRLEDAAAVAKFSKSVLGIVAPASSPGAFAHFAAGAASRAREAACGGRGPARRRGGAEWEGGGV